MSASRKIKSGIDSSSNRAKKRRRTSYKNTGKKRVQIIGILPDVQENYENCKLLFDLSKVNKMKYTLACDLKALNKTLGLGPHSSSYPCAYCRCRNHKTQGWLHPPSETCSCFLRTLGSLKEQYSLWKDSGGEDKDPTGTSSFSVTNAAILDQPGDSKKLEVLDLCPPCSLHLKLGVNEV